MVKLLFDIKVEKKVLYKIGRIGFGCTLILFALCLMSGVIDQGDDLKSYYSLCQYFRPRDYHGRDQKEQLDDFQKQSLFDVQRMLNLSAMIVSGGLIIANNVNGPLLGILSIAYYGLIHMNPWVFNDQVTQLQRWDLLVKYIALVGGMLLILTRGKLKNEDQRVRFNARLNSSR